LYEIDDFLMSSYIHLNSTTNNYGSNSWTVLTDIERRIKEKIEKVGTPLKDWDIQINYGIKTGFNDAFIIDGAKRKELIEKHPKSEEIIRPILRGRDIKRYSYEVNDLWLIYIPWHFPLHNNESISGVSEAAENQFMIQYPAIYNHLLQYKNELSNRNKAETGIRYEWYALQRWGSNYWNDFSKPKIMYPNMTKFLPFYYNESGFYQNDKSFMIVGENIEYLTAFLNSSLFKFCFLENFPELQGGTRELRKIFFDKIPVLKVNSNTNKTFNDLVLKIQSLKIIGIDIKEFEMKIDDMIFDLYGLSDEEKKTIGYIEII